MEEEEENKKEEEDEEDEEDEEEEDEEEEDGEGETTMVLAFTSPGRALFRSGSGVSPDLTPHLTPSSFVYKPSVM